MAEGPDDQARTRAAILGALVLVGLLGHALWLVNVDASPTPFLPTEAAQAREDVRAAFPNVTSPTARVVMVAEGDGTVLSPQALTLLAGLRNRISSDPAITPVLADQEPVGSVLTTLAPHLEGRPGEWDEGDVREALATATASGDGRRAMALYLGRSVQFQAEETRAQATVLVVRFDAGASEDAIARAQDRVRELAEASQAPSLAVTTQSEAARTSAARSLPGLWVPLLSLTLLGIGALLLQLPSPVVRHSLALWVGASGAGLLLGLLLGHATPFSLATAHVGAALAMAALWAMPGAGGAPATIAIPLAGLAGWSTAGLGEIALVGAGAAGMAGALPALAPAWPALPEPTRDLRDEAKVLPQAPWVVLLAGALVLVPLGTLAFHGLSDTAQPGWQGTVPSTTEAGKAEAAVAEHFQDPGPVSEFTIAAWGPVTEPGFWAAVEETEDRLTRLSLATTGGRVETVRSLAEDWATDTRDRDPTDVYDPDFQELWRNATQGGEVPVRNVEEVLAALAILDPAGLDALLQAPALEGPGAQGVLLIRQRVTLPAVIPRPTEAVTAAAQPVVAASERVAIGGSALEADQTRQALLAQAPWVLGALLAASLLAGWLCGATLTSRPGMPVALGASAAAATLLTGATLGLLGLPTGPATQLAPGLAGAATILLAGVVLARMPSEGTPGELALEEGLLASRAARLHAGVPLTAMTIASITTPAPGVRALGLGLLVALVAAGLVTKILFPTLARRWLQVASRTQGPMLEGPAPVAHTVCRVCQEPTTTGACRCRACGQWNLLEACTVHPGEHGATCAACGADLDVPHLA